MLRTLRAVNMRRCNVNDDSKRKGEALSLLAVIIAKEILKIMVKIS